MGKPIELTWRNKHGEVITEQCLLISEDDHIFFMGDDTPVTIISDTGVGNTVASIMRDQVMFEDDFGLFCLSPENVLNIKEL